MASLTDLINRRSPKGFKNQGPPAKLPAPPTAADDGPPAGYQRLQFLIEHHRLPTYLRVRDAQSFADLCDPNSVAGQARKEWPNIAKNLCLEPGEILGDLPAGVLIQTGGVLLECNLMALWAVNRLFY